jgi:hypothetical protein
METNETISDKEKPPLIRRILASDKFAELAAAQIMTSLENFRFRVSRPRFFGLRREQLSPIPTEGVESWVFHHIGDVLEVAYLFSGTRLAIAGVNEALKQVTKGKEIPDEACFWASMATSVIVPTLMELNIISLFGGKLNSSPDPADLFGIGVSALVIIASHYASKHREPIKKVASMAATRIANGWEIMAEKLNEFDEKMYSLGRPDVAIGTKKPDEE